jgi:hypothetical protein
MLDVLAAIMCMHIVLYAVVLNKLYTNDVSHCTAHIVSTIVGTTKATGAPAAKKSKIGWNSDRIKVSSLLLLVGVLRQQYCAENQLQKTN